MKFRTADLIAFVEKEIEARTTAADGLTEKTLQTYREARADWLASGKPERIRAIAQRLSEKVRKGRIVTEDDVAEILENRHTQDTIYFRGGSEPKKKEPILGNLPALRDFLKTVADEEVSTSTLATVGFTKLAAIYRGAAE